MFYCLGIENYPAVTSAEDSSEAKVDFDDLFQGGQKIEINSIDVELLQAKWKKILESIDSKNIAYLNGLQQKAVYLSTSLDDCIKRMDSIEEFFSLLFLHVKVIYLLKNIICRI